MVKNAPQAHSVRRRRLAWYVTDHIRAPLTQYAVAQSAPNTTIRTLKHAKVTSRTVRGAPAMTNVTTRTWPAWR